MLVLLTGCGGGSGAGSEVPTSVAAMAAEPATTQARAQALAAMAREGSAVETPGQQLAVPVLPPVRPPNRLASLRALNLSTDLPGLDLYVDSSRQFASVAVDALTESASISAGNHNLTVTRPGDSQTLLIGSYAFTAASHSTAVAWGRQSALRLTYLPEDEDNSAIPAGQHRLRVLSASSDAGALDIYITAADALLSGATPIRVAVPSGSLTGFSELAAGSYRLRVTGASNPDDLRLDIPVITLADKRHATLVVTDGPGGVLVNGTLLEQQGAATSLKNTQARLRVAASADSGGSVALRWGDAALTAGLRSPAVASYARVTAGSNLLTLAIDGSVISALPQSLLPGTDYTVLVLGSAANGRSLVIADDNRPSPFTQRARLRLVHGLAAPAPLSLTVDFAAALVDVPAGAASAYAGVAANVNASLGVYAAQAPGPLFQASVNLAGQGVYSVFMLAGAPAPVGIVIRER